MKNKNAVTQNDISCHLALEREGGTQCQVRGKVHKANLIHTPSSALRASSPSRGKETRGFTLIELLVVVLIIGILAAVAVPQYQKAVLKSRFATVKDLVHSLAQAEEVYYLANNEYTADFEALDVTTPPSEDEETHDTWAQRKWDWGKCILSKSSAYVGCQFKINGTYVMLYQIYLNHGTPQTWCVAYSGDLNAPSNQLCKAETGKSQPYEEVSRDTSKVWVY